MNHLELIHVNKHYGKKYALKNFSFRTCSHRICAYIFKHNSAENKENICRHGGE